MLTLFRFLCFFRSGVQFSCGQMRHVAIANVMYGQQEILLLDETTSALNNETEKNTNQVYSVSLDRTLIVIAHLIKCN